MSGTQSPLAHQSSLRRCVQPGTQLVLEAVVAWPARPPFPAAWETCHLDATAQGVHAVNLPGQTGEDTHVESDPSALPIAHPRWWKAEDRVDTLAECWGQEPVQSGLVYSHSRRPVTKSILQADSISSLPSFSGASSFAVSMPPRRPLVRNVVHPLHPSCHALK